MINGENKDTFFPVLYRFPGLDFRFFLFCCLVVNAVFLLAENHGSDMGFWVDWTRQLRDRGYADFNGNYPPVYVHWLYLCGLLSKFNLFELNNNLEFKALAFAPVIVAHMSLIRLAESLANRYDIDYSHRIFVFCLIAFNPAFIMDGPVWGQVDVLPTAICAWAIYLALNVKTELWVMPLFMLSLLTKFQMISLAPVVGAIFLSRIRVHFIGGIISLAVFFVVYFPFVLTDNFVNAFKFAYIDTLGQYPVASLNAANIQLLLFGNEVADGISLVATDSQRLENLLTIKHLAMLIYALFSLFLMLRLAYFLLFRSQIGVQVFTYASLSAVAFFMILPGMHERYLIPGVVLLVVASVVNPKLKSAALALSAFAAINIALILPLKGELLWKPLAFVSFLASLSLLAETFYPNAQEKLRRRLAGSWITLSRYLRYGAPEVVVIVLIVLVVGREWAPSKKHFNDPMKDMAGISLASLPVERQSQGWGDLRINRSASGGALKFNDHVFRSGLGVHANSEIVFELPAGYTKFAFMYGLDDFSKGGLVRFKVYGDEQLLWSSKRISNKDELMTAVVEIDNINKLKLVVESLGSINGDHADWLNPLLIK